MPTIRSTTDERDIEAVPGETILDATLRAEIPHTHVCGGRARCSTCRVHIIEGLEHVKPRSGAEQALSDKLGLPDDIRLACQAHVVGDVTLRRGVVDDLDIEIISEQFGEGAGSSLGREIDAAILFTDLVNYTEFTAALPAYDVVHVLNRYYRSMNDIVEEKAGVISDVAGDGILALFGVMEDRENPVEDALSAVHAMNQALTVFNEHLQQMYRWSFGIRAGIHFGSVIVGRFDTGLMRKVAAIGDAVNLASRIESANKAFGTELLISEAAYDRVQSSVEAHSVGPAALKGKDGLFTLYSVSP